MRILLLNDYATPTAGAELTTVRIRDALRESGHEPRVLASRAQLIAGPSFADADCFGSTGRLQVLSALANPSAARALRREIGGFRPHVVHVNMSMWQLSPSILPVLRKVPCLYYAMVYRDVCPTGSKRLPDGNACLRRAGLTCLRDGCLTPAAWGARMLQQAWWLRERSSFDRIVAVSAAVRDRLEEAGVSVDDIVWPGVPQAAAGRGPGETPTVTYAGRLVPEKGVDVLLRAFRTVLDDRHPGASLLVAGTGPEEPRLRALASRLGLDSAVAWLGQLTPAETDARFAGAWVHAVPSTWAEPFGLTTTEAMMRGTPAVVSATGGLADSVVDGQTGFHVPPADADALAEALGDVLANRALAVRMGAAARARALAACSIGQCRDRLLAHYHDLIGGCPS
jgi:glycosyltransferase involved in cell wall biosynthesis